jgi:hypothetical protein
MAAMATAADVQELLEKVHEERVALLAGVDGLTEERAEQRPPEGDGEDGWSAKEQLSHLAEMEVSYRATAQQAVTGREVERAPVRYPLETAHDATVAELVEELLRLREETVAYIESLPLDAFDAKVVSGAFPEMSVLQWLRSYYRHDRMHLAQIQGRKSDYQPRFVGGEPDQRRRA